jgi:thioredoxin 1
MTSTNIINISADSFTEDVTNSKAPILVDFWAPWCGPCRAVAPILEQLALKYNGIAKIGKVNIDENPALAAKFRVMSIPTLILFKDGKPVQQMVGLRSVDELEAMLKSVV